MDMAQMITLKQSEYQKLIDRISKLETQVSKMVQFFQKEPSYGSDAWWKWANKKGMEALKKGEYTEITTDKQRKSYFKSL
jgi:hypothetical protein